MKTPPRRVVPAVLTPSGQPGTGWSPTVQAPASDGTNVSIPPMFGGHGPGVEITGVDTPKLAVGTADPAFHGGG